MEKIILEFCEIKLWKGNSIVLLNRDINEYVYRIRKMILSFRNCIRTQIIFETYKDHSRFKIYSRLFRVRSKSERMCEYNACVKSFAFALFAFGIPLWSRNAFESIFEKYFTMLNVLFKCMHSGDSRTITFIHTNNSRSWRMLCYYR